MTPLLFNSRYEAARILQGYLEHGVMPQHRLQTLDRDRAFITEMVLGVVRRQYGLDWILSKLVPRRVPTGKVRPVLWIGLYQVLFMDEVEPYAAVYETVEAAKSIRTRRHAPLVNAVLRRALRERTRLLDELHQQPPTIRFSHPASLLARWRAAFGEADTLRLCVWNNRKPALLLRVRPPLTRAAALEQLLRDGIPAEPAIAHPDFIVLADMRPVAKCPGFAEGAYMVQDPATLLAVDLLDPQPGEQIADLCAAPGGKAVAIADRLLGQGLWASDINPLRIQQLEANCRRCGYRDVRLATFNAVSDTTEQTFDGLLLDVPCSNTGVIRRRPDARYRLDEAQLKQLTELQAAMLDQASRSVRPGGRLVYSTCSLETEENDGQVRAWLQRHPEFELEEATFRFPPHDHTDGAYAARLRRKR